MRDKLNIFIAFLLLLVVSACKTEAPVDLQETVDNNYQFSYSQNDIVLYKNLSAFTIKPLLDNALIYTYTVTPPLPSGLLVDQNTGVISGTPQVSTGAPAYYTITATSHLKITQSTLKLEVKDEPLTNISYPINPIVMEVGVFSPIVLPVVSGGTPTHYSIEPTLNPALGLTFNTTTGQVTGTPLQVNTTKQYEVTAHNNGNEISTILFLDIKERAPFSVNYASSSFNLIRGNPMNPIPPIFTGGKPTSYTVAPALPTGLALNATTGEISGTPALATPMSNYTVTASNTGGSFSFSVNITVTDIAPNFGRNANGVYDFITYTAVTPGSGGNTITLNFNGVDDIQDVVDNWNTLNPANQVAHNYVAINPSPNYAPHIGTAKLNGIYPDEVIYGHVKFVAVSPADPGIISLGFDGVQTLQSIVDTWNTANPTNQVAYQPVLPVSPPGSLTLSGGLDDQVIYDFSSAPVDALMYNSGTATLTLYKDIPMGSYAPTYEYVSGVASMFIVDKVLPPGISIDPITGVISGTPVGVLTMLPYQITGSNQVGSTGGSDAFTLFIEVVEKAPTSFYYDTVAVNYVKDVEITKNMPHFSGSTAYYYTVSPPLPAGITLDYYSGEIVGTPLQATASATYTVTVTNGGGSAQVNLTIGVQDSDPGLLNYTNPTMETICNTPFIDNYPQNFGSGLITNYYQLPGPVLPTGTVIDPSTGIISGIPTQAMNVQEFQIMGSNNGGLTQTSSPASVFIKVKPEKPDFRYDITQASNVYDGVTYTATEYGAIGNQITLVFDGFDSIHDVITNWNLNHPSNGVSENYAGNDMSKIPPAGSVTLENGSDVIKLFMGQITERNPTLTSCALGEYFTNYSVFPTGVTLDPATGKLTSTAETRMTRRQPLNIGATNETDTTIKDVQIQIDYLHDPGYVPASSTFLKFDKDDNYQDLVLFTKACTSTTPPELCNAGKMIIFRGNDLNEYVVHSETSIKDIEVPADSPSTPIEKRFQPASNYAFNLIKAADINGDQAEDLILFDNLTSKLFVLENYQANSATPRTFKFVKSFDALPNLNKAEAKDLNADGKVEIILSNNTNKINVVQYDEAEKIYKLDIIVFTALDSTTNTDQDAEDDDGTSYGISSIQDFVLVDTDGDGELYDIVAVDDNKNRVCVINGDSESFFGDSCAYGFALKGKPLSLAFSDFNQDGTDDIIILLENGKLDIYFGDGSNFSENYTPRFAEPANSRILFSKAPEGAELFMQDTNDDTYADLIIVEPSKRTYVLEWDIILTDFKIPLLTEVPMMNTYSLGLNNFELPGFAWFACNDINKSCGITQFTVGTHPITTGGGDDGGDDDDDWF